MTTTDEVIMPVSDTDSDIRYLLNEVKILKLQLAQRSQLEPKDSSHNYAGDDDDGDISFKKAAMESVMLSENLINTPMKGRSSKEVENRTSLRNARTSNHRYDDKSQSSDSDESHSSNEDSNRRFSVLRDVTNSKRYNTRQVVSVNQVPYNGARLDKLSIYHVMRFIDEVQRYQAQWSTQIAIATYVSDTVKRTLLANSRGKLTEGCFYQLTPKVLLKEVQRFVRPKSSLAFSKALMDNIQFDLPENYSPCH